MAMLRLFSAAKILGDANINIEYGYAYAGKSESVFYMRVNDSKKAVEVLEKAGIRLVTTGEI